MVKGLSWSGGYTQNADGTISAKKSFLGSLTGSDSDRQLQAMQYNQALKQYNEQFQFQKDQFAFNKQMAEDTFAFNKDLSNRQQALAEESYYNGVSNQARQLASLGINPASQGQSLSSATMSGGSNISQPSANASGTSATAQSSSALGSAGFQGFLGILSSILQVGQLASSISYNNKMADVAVKNADTSRLQADSQALKTESDIRVNERNIASSIINDSYVIAQTNHINSQSDYQKMWNDFMRDSSDRLSTFGINPYDVQMLRGIDWQVAIAMGIYSIFGNAGSDSNYDSSVSEPTKAQWQQVMKSAQSYEDLAPKQANAVDRFYSDHPNINRTGRDFPASNLVEWSRDPKKYTDDYIYSLLCKYYGV